LQKESRANTQTRGAAIRQQGQWLWQQDVTAVDDEIMQQMLHATAAAAAVVCRRGILFCQLNAFAKKQICPGNDRMAQRRQ